MASDAPVIDVFDTASGPQGLPIALGIPFPAGMLLDASALRVTAPGGATRPSAARVLVPGGDGSVRWALLAFSATERGPHRVVIAEGPAPLPPEPVEIREKDDGVAVANGLVCVELCRSGPGPISRMAALGHEHIAAPQQFRLCVDDADTTLEQQRTITILEASPIRARLRVEGGHYRKSGERRLSYRLDVEMWHGWPSVRLDYTFLHLEPGLETLDVRTIALACDLQLGASPRRHFLQKNHGLFYVPREVHNAERVAIVADGTRAGPHVEHESMLLDEVDYPEYLHPPLVETQDWLGVHDGERGVYMQMQEFAEMRPKRLVSRDASLALEAWPARAGTLRLPQGRSRRQVVSLAFTDEAQPSLTWITEALAAPLNDGHASVAPQWLAHCAEFDQDRVLPPGRHIRLEKFFNGLMRLTMPMSMFDFGDTADSGYGRSYVAGGTLRRRDGAPQMEPVFTTGSGARELADSYSYEPAWTNNEYDAIWAFCCELMRTGRPVLWPVLRQLARHNIEVDFLHYSDHRWLHRATPAHSARHTTTGAYPSHFWTQGLLEYYCLTGDVDALEVAVALGDKIIKNFSDPELRKVQVGFNREVGWSVLALSYLADITGEERFWKQLEELAEYLMAYDRDAFAGKVNLSAGNKRQSLVRQMIGNFFGYASMIEGFDHYARVSGREDVAEWLDSLLGELLTHLEAAHREGESGGSMSQQAMAIGYERSGDPRFLRAGMIGVDQMFAFREPACAGEVKPTASTYRALVRFLTHALDAGMLDRLEYPSAR